MQPLRSLAAAAALLALTLPAAADYPEREITLIVPFGAGGSTDIVGRIAAQALSERLGVPVVVDNRGGAGGTVGTQYAAQAQPDGYTLTVATTSTHVIGPLTNPTVPYDPLTAFDLIGMIAETPYVLVTNPDLGAATVAELVEQAHSAPGEMNYGSAGQGSASHLAGLMFLAATGTEMEHVPYGSGAAAATATMGNEVQLSFVPVPTIQAQVAAGSLDALGVGTAARSLQLPEVPTLQEAGVDGYRSSLWLGLAAPAGTPDAILAELNDALADALADAAVREQLTQNGADPSPLDAAAFRELIETEMTVYGAIVAAMN